jgi:hypothetical protein
LRCMRQYLYFCKASKLSTWRAGDSRCMRQYLYFCTSKASKLSTWRAGDSRCMRMCATTSFATCRIRQHTSAYVSIRCCQHVCCMRMCATTSFATCRIRRHTHTSAYVSIRCCQHACHDIFRNLPRTFLSPPPPLRIRQHMSAYVSICQHTSAYVTCRNFLSAPPRSPRAPS